VSERRRGREGSFEEGRLTNVTSAPHYHFFQHLRQILKKKNHPLDLKEFAGKQVERQRWKSTARAQKVSQVRRRKKKDLSLVRCISYVLRLNGA